MSVLWEEVCSGSVIKAPWKLCEKEIEIGEVEKERG